MIPVLFAAALAAAPAPWPQIAFTPVAAGFSSPTQVTSAHDGSGRLFVVEQRGLVKIVKDGVVLPVPFLDIRDRVSCCGERGLLSIVFPPGAGPHGTLSKPFDLYANYTDVNGDTTVSVFYVSNDPDVVSAGSERILLKIAQPFANHNGGQLAFGPDGYLYIGMGDGGSAGDPNNNAQNLSSLLGKILRIDVVGRTSYAIPATNPFAGSGAARPEIWAYGLRNPWRFSFDRKTGDLYIGDVGQGAWEEVDFQPAGAAGGANYGWRVTEGAHCFNPGSGCSFAGITPPVAEYSHAGGNCSITGGFVYRGRDSARLSGIYFYADYCSGRVWGLRNSASGWEPQELLTPGYAITSFGEDEAGEVYAVDGRSGILYRLADADGPLSILTVPIVVDAAGANGAHFVSEITLGNRGTTGASVEVTFTASTALGSTGSGTFTTAVPAGRQLVYPDAMQWLRENGLAVPTGNQGGTLRLAYSGLSSGDMAFSSVRTLTVLPEGRAGLAYPGLSTNDILEAKAALYGLREDASFRSNLALLNAGDPATGAFVTLRVTIFSGAAGDGRSVVLPDVTLAPGQWMQLNRVLAPAGYSNGWANVERASGTEPFYAYAVVNDNVTGDGAFVAPEPVGKEELLRILPVAVRTGGFVTELVLTNPGDDPITLSFFGDAVSSKDVVLQAREQRFIPDVLLYLGSSYPATALEISSRTGAESFHASARTTSAAAGGGTFGVAYSALAPAEVARADAWVFGLKQDGSARSNLALANTVPPPSGSPPTPSPVEISVEFFDGDTGLSAGFQTVSLDTFYPTWIQLDSPFAARGIRTGYVHVRAPAGNFVPFIVYGIVNDGAV
ncbi:MAG: PQQ-dependent sugar dehydrogenase, partial [Thermoanaerobaculia bacterium]|nr:PQQ-dependent sugar dehydrogenase [Thermoanaerobaculia bacterium]